jgi:DNA-binding MarR family transcriptional regulator
LGITHPQYLVLSVLWEGDGQTTRWSSAWNMRDWSFANGDGAGFEGQPVGDAGNRSTRDERQVGVHLTDSGKALRSRTACLTDTLLQRSGMTVEEIISLNERIQTFRKALTEYGAD